MNERDVYLSQQTCARCGMDKTEWEGGGGQGVFKNGKAFCCDGCAQGVGCTCVNRVEG